MVSSDDRIDVCDRFLGRQDSSACENQTPPADHYSSNSQKTAPMGMTPMHSTPSTEGTLCIKGPLVLALGAGIGEEALFRGWMQPALVQTLMESSPEYASLGGLLGTSLIFGLGHAVTGTYFVWATVFGVLMGVEYNTIGLPAVALTHAFYDWTAFLTLTAMWTSPKKSE